MKKIIIVGGGAAGMFAAVSAANEHTEVHIYEHNEKLGKKLFITGKGRCNITNGCDDVEELLSHVVTNARFLYSAFYTFSNQDMMQFLTEQGLELKTERGQRVFPVSDKSSDVIRTLERVLKDRHVQVHLKQQVCDLWIEDNEIRGIFLSGGEKVEADVVILAAGGVSYPSTGSTGDGYRFAKKSGHTIAPLSPSLVPMTVKEDYCMQMQGLSLKNVEVKIKDGKKVLFEEFGEMLFTHFGVSGPLILSASSEVNDKIQKKELAMEIDLKPALPEEKLDARILRDFEENKNRQFKNVLSGLLPAKMIPVMVSLSGITPEKKINEITKEERRRLVNCIKHFPMTLTGLRDYNEAIITRGGVAVKNIDPSTMQSKLVKGLYFAGEVIDVDAYTGGFNLQIAWSTGYLAGSSIEEEDVIEKYKNKE